MERVIVKDNLTYDCSKITGASFEVVSNSNLNINLTNFDNEKDINIDVKDNSVLLLSIFAFKSINSAKITANVGQNSKIIVYFADFAIEKNHLDASINLNKENASAEWHLASLSSNVDDKEIAVNIYHNSPLTYGRIDNYGVCKEQSKLVFSGISHIEKGCHKSASHQNAKIVVFDDNCKAIAKPILKIDENDIEASHAAVVGKVSDEHMFYLTSRGLSREEAKLLITLGYLKPILAGFDAETQQKINEEIEGRL